MTFLPFLYLLFLCCLLAILAGLILYHARFFFDFLKGLPRQTLFLLAIILLIALFLRVCLIPHTFRIYYDEFDFLNLAQNITHHHVYGLTVIGDKAHALKVIPYFRPGGFPLLLSIFFVIAGDSAQAAFLANALMGSFSVALIFLCAYLLFKNPCPAFFSGLIASLYPLHLQYSGCAAADISSFFFLCLSLFVLLLFLETKKSSLAFLLAATLVYVSYIKPENAVLIPVAAALMLWKKPLPAKKLFDWSYFLLALSLPLLRQLPAIAKIETLSAKGAFWSWRYLMEYLPGNLAYLGKCQNAFLPGVLFAFLGAPLVYHSNKRIFFYLSLSFLCFLVISSGYFAGGFWGKTPLSGGDRYFLPGSLPLILLAGAGICSFIGLFKKRGRLIPTAIVSAGLVLNFLGSGERFQRRPCGQNGQTPAIIKESEFLKNSAALLDDRLYVVTNVPSFVIVGMGKRAWLINDFSVEEPSLQKAYVLKNFMWPQKEYDHFRNQLEKIYEIKILAEASFKPGLRTSVVEITKRP